MCAPCGDLTETGSGACARPVEVDPVVVDEQAPQQAERLPALPAPGGLEGVKSKRQPVLSLRLREPGVDAATPREEAPTTLPAAATGARGSSLFLGLAGRVSLTGLSEEQASSLGGCLEAGGAEGGASGSWSAWRREGLRVVVLSETGSTSLAEQLIAAATQAPHVICVRLCSLQGHGGACAVLRNYKGALVVIEDGDAGDEEDEAAGLLRTLGVATRWRATGCGFEAAVLPALQVTKVIGDLKVSDLESDPMLAALVAVARPLYEKHFHEDLLDEVKSWEGAHVAFLVAPDRQAPEKQFLGLVVYKFWGAPLRAMSVLRVAVPDRCRMLGYGRQLMRWALEKARQKPRRECARVTLCAVPEAVAFYERLSFARVPVESLEPLPEDEALPPPLPGAVWMEYRCVGRAK